MFQLKDRGLDQVYIEDGANIKQENKNSEIK